MKLMKQCFFISVTDIYSTCVEVEPFYRLKSDVTYIKCTSGYGTDGTV